MIASVSDDATVRIWGPAPQYRGSAAAQNGTKATANGISLMFRKIFCLTLLYNILQYYVSYYFRKFDNQKNGDYKEKEYHITVLFIVK